MFICMLIYNIIYNSICASIIYSLTTIPVLYAAVISPPNLLPSIFADLLCMYNICV